MAALTWDQDGTRMFETGVDRGVLYPKVGSEYPMGYAWNGLTAVTESPSGAESNKQYADNIPYLNLTSLEELGATIEAFTYPDEFAACDGTASPEDGVTIGQQPRQAFGLSYRTRVGNDTDGDSHGEKIHVIYNAKAAPTEKAYATVNDSPEAMTFSWELTTTAVEVTGYRPTSQLTFDSTKLSTAQWTALTEALWGTASEEPNLPSPDELIALVAAAAV